MSAILGIALAALIFGVATRLRARDRDGCTGGCAGCTGDGRCERTDEATNAEMHGAKS
jgi:hypothetical protein